MMKARTGWLALVMTLLVGGLALAQEVPKAKKSVPPSGGVQAPPPSGIQVPQPEVLLLLIRSALVGLDHANRTGNYSVLRELGGPSLQQHSTAQLSDAFAALRSNKIDLLPAMILTPQLTKSPKLSPESLLELVGFFPTQPRRIQFQIIYQPFKGQWKLAGLNVGLAEAPEATVEPKADDAVKSKAGKGTPTAKK